MDDPLYLIRMVIRQRAIFEYAKRIHLPIEDLDMGYAVHAFLTALWGSDAPRPFQWDPRMPEVVLAYSARGRHELKMVAETYAPPDVYEAVDWERFSMKPLPEYFEENQQLGFSIRICPVARMNRTPGDRASGTKELDVFLAKCERLGREAKLDRFDIYNSWVADQLPKREAAVVQRVSVVGFLLDSLFRRSQLDDERKRRGKILTRPNVSVQGSLIVNDPTEFRRLLSRGVGRHKTFGFGMILLHRPS